MPLDKLKGMFFNEQFIEADIISPLWIDLYEYGK